MIDSLQLSPQAVACLCLSTDLRQNEPTLDKTLVEFKLDPETQKYKMDNIEVKLLGI